MGQREDRAAEAAHGGVVARDGDIALLGDGSRWWLNGEPWARADVDAGLARVGQGVALATTAQVSINRMIEDVELAKHGVIAIRHMTGMA